MGLPHLAHAAAAGADGANGFPQLPQNFTPGFTGAPQLGQAAAGG
jgi:hypothetical protein